MQCVLVNTIPGSDFDDAGVCSWCRNKEQKYLPHGKDVLNQTIRLMLRPDSIADCIVGISGGKDSSFALWALKKHFGLRVEAFTYDHDGVSESAHENIRRVCSSLDVPLHVFSLGGHRHLDSFRDYFKAFIARPSTVTAGMTCVACKHLHLFGTQLAMEKNAPFAVWANCPLEYSPFLALKQRGNGTSRDGILKGGALLLQEMFRSPRLLSSIASHFTLTLNGCLAFAPSSKYLRLRYPSVEQLVLFEYWPWNPTEIYDTLITETGWRKPDVPDDWHSDCLFNVFKEYLFQSMFGASYTDGFLSNQIRAGLITREQALIRLIESKRFYAQALPGALDEAGLSHLIGKIDLSCFTIDES